MSPALPSAAVRQPRAAPGTWYLKKTHWDVATGRDLDGLAIVSRNKFPF